MRRKTLQMEIKIYGGSDIEQASKDAVELAKKLDIDVWFDFNGVHTLARPTDNPDKIVDAYNSAIRSEHKYKVACAK